MSPTSNGRITQSRLLALEIKRKKHIFQMNMLKFLSNMQKSESKNEGPLCIKEMSL
jgi:hypothetical protein